MIFQEELAHVPEVSVSRRPYSEPPICATGGCNFPRATFLLERFFIRLTSTVLSLNQRHDRTVGDSPQEASDGERMVAGSRLTLDSFQQDKAPPAYGLPPFSVVRVFRGGMLICMEHTGVTKRLSIKMRLPAVDAGHDEAEGR
jgi:hypothetical protein